MKTKLLYLSLLLSMSIFLSSCGGDDDEQEPELELATVKTKEAITTTATSATVSGEVTDDGNAEITEAGFVYSSLIAEPTVSDNKVTVTNFETFSAEITGLNSGTAYNVRAYAINEKGAAYGEKRTFTTSNLAPVATNVAISGSLEVSKTLTATYNYADTEGDEEGATVLQWYIANTAAGEGEEAIAGATASTLVIDEDFFGKFIRVSVTPKAEAGTTDGVEVKSAFTTEVGAETVTFMYNDEEVTYGTIVGPDGNKWLDRNLGASRVAQSIDDYEAFGDLFQWGRLADGHQLIERTGPEDADMSGVTGITSTTAPYELSEGDVPTTDKFIIRGGFSGNGDWMATKNNELWQGVDGINNPCPSGWRVATGAEWIALGFETGAQAFAELKLPFTGKRMRATGNFEYSTSGLYWTSQRLLEEDPDGVLSASMVYFNAEVFSTDAIGDWGDSRASGHACRCIKD